MDFNSIWKAPKATALTVVMALGLGGLAVEGAEHLGIINPPASLHLAPADEPASHNTFAPVVRRVLPAVVNISSSKMVKTSFEGGQQGADPFSDPLFRQFFGDNGGGRQFRVPRQQQQKEEGLGSGVIVSPEGYILTNNHVVDGATDVRVTLADRREFKARVVGTDPKTDVAVVKIDANNLTPIVIGDSSKIQTGDYVLAVGDPFGVGKTVTMGIVSATGRANLGIEDYENFIQTDASINPGNSGGALVNDRGELVGINTAILAHGSEGNQGIGFAIPVNEARDVMDQIIAHGKVTRAYLGVMAQEVTPEIARAFHESEVTGALIGDVTPNSPASEAGLQKGDIIVGLNGKPVDSAAQLRMNVSLMQPGSNVNVKVLREGVAKDFNVKLQELPTETAKAERPNNPQENAMDGVSVQSLDASTARQLGLPPNASGVVVTGVDPNSDAADSGLQKGDVIQEVNHHAIANMRDFQSALRNSPNNQPLLLVNRQGNTMYIVA